MVPALAQAAVAVGADGLMIETHNDPAKAKSDGAQSLTPRPVRHPDEYHQAGAGVLRENAELTVKCLPPSGKVAEAPP